MDRYYTAIIVRPGETDFDRQERIQGTLDLPLTEAGHRQVLDLIRALREYDPEVVFSSYTDPAASTARAIGEALQIPVKQTDALENMDYGLWQGMLAEDIRRKHPRIFRQWQDAPESVCPPQGETCETVASRVQKALKKPKKRGDTFVVVAPEPLASIISSVLKENALSIPSLDQHGTNDHRLDIVTNQPEQQPIACAEGASISHGSTAPTNSYS